MEEYNYKRNYHHHVPAFGSWDWNDNLPFTQCFESARQAGLLRYNTYSSDHHPHEEEGEEEEEEEEEDRDLYVTGDLYDNHVVTPAMIVVPRRREKARSQHEKDVKKQNWVKEPPSPIPISRPTPKPIDEDLYKISPDLLYAKTRKKRGLCFFSSCLQPTCMA